MSSEATRGVLIMGLICSSRRKRWEEKELAASSGLALEDVHAIVAKLRLDGLVCPHASGGWVPTKQGARVNAGGFWNT